MDIVTRTNYPTRVNSTKDTSIMFAAAYVIIDTESYTNYKRATTDSSSQKMIWPPIRNVIIPCLLSTDNKHFFSFPSLPPRSPPPLNVDGNADTRIIRANIENGAARGFSELWPKLLCRRDLPEMI